MKLIFKIFLLTSINNGPKTDISGLNFTDMSVKARSICF